MQSSRCVALSALQAPSRKTKETEVKYVFSLRFVLLFAFVPLQQQQLSIHPSQQKKNRHYQQVKVVHGNNDARG